MGPAVKPSMIIFTDLDGTLLDPKTYRWDAAKPALGLCREKHVPVILASSKTRAELEIVLEALALPFPFITENGGGIYFPETAFDAPPKQGERDKGRWKLSLGIPYPDVVRGFRDIREELGWRMRGFSDMTPEEIGRVTGLDPGAARLAAKREYDEPFLILEKEAKDPETLSRAAVKRGFTLTSGGRFYHLQGRHDKGRAMEEVLVRFDAIAQPVCSMALGDSENDFSMLERADYPVLIRSKRRFPGLEARIPRLRITRETGPRGWNRAVWDILRKEEEATHE